MAEVRALIAAAGRGSRAGLPYPKTLYPFQGTPILVRIAELLAPYDPEPTVVVSPEGAQPILQCLSAHGKAAHLVVQPEPHGMGDAVLRFDGSPAAASAEHVLLIWGDIPMICPETVARLVQFHLEEDNHFSFATRHVDAAYTVVSRHPDDSVRGVVETREAGKAELLPGERDIGLFLFRKQLVLDALRESDPRKHGLTTGEHGFLYIIGVLAERGYRVKAFPIAAAQDLVSLNSLDDVKDHE